MASMDRNVNLEEINTEVFMNISYLAYQTIFQKVIFVIGILLSIAIDVCGTIFLNANINICMMFGVIPLIIGIAFGCNYNEDFSLIEYIVFVITRPNKAYYKKPYEALNHLHSISQRIIQEEALLEKQRKSNFVDRKKLLIFLVLGLVVFILTIALIVIFIKSNELSGIHHVVLELS